MNKTRLFIILSLLFLSTISYSQLKVKGEAQAGFYRNNSEDSGSTKLYSELLGKANYKLKSNSVVFQSDLNVNSSFYNIDNNYSILRISGGISYFSLHKNLNWGINLSAKNYNYDLNEYLSSSLYQTEFQISSAKLTGKPLILSVGYLYQNIEANLFKSMDLAYVTSSVLLKCKGIKNSISLHLEKFKIGEDFTESGNDNEGFRLGTSLSFIYSDTFLLQVYYKFMLHKSDIVKNFSPENNLRISFGEYLTNKLSLYFLVDYYNRNFSFNGNQQNVLPLTYLPMETENKYTAKIVFDVNNNFEVFFRTGYVSENVFLNNIQFSSFIAAIGLEISF